MPLWGAPTSSRWGHPDEMCATIELADFGDGVRVRIKPHAGYGQWARLVVDGIPQGPPVFLPESQFSQLIGLYESDESPHIVSVVPQGDWADDSIDPSYQQTSFMAGRSDRIYAQVTTSTEQFSYGDSSQLTSWALTGRLGVRFYCAGYRWPSNCRRDGRYDQAWRQSVFVWRHGHGHSHRMRDGPTRHQ